jgi:signal transduction histidine kinase
MAALMMYSLENESPRSLTKAYEAALTIAAELDVDEVLHRIVDLAREIVPARYAAIGVCNEDGLILDFITSGLASEEIMKIGPLPRGEGLLGVLIRDGEPLIVDDMAADPRSVGFPPNHPPMRSLIGVPIQLGNRVLGDLYLTDALGGSHFTIGDLEVLEVLAAHAATAIDRASLYRQVEEGKQRAEVQRDKLQVVLDNLPLAIFLHGSDSGQLEMANEAAHAMLNDNLNSSDRSNAYELVDTDGNLLPQEALPAERALQGQTVRNQQALLKISDGHTVPVLVQAAPLLDAAGIPIQAVVVLQDVTRLREAEQLKDDFLSLISHEFRTPLTAINGGAHLLAHQGEELDAETGHDLLLDIVSESTKLDRMLANMLSVAAIMAGRLEPDTEPVLVEPLARRISAEVQSRSPGVEFRVDIPRDMPMADGDPDLIGQTIRNLYENAVKYSPNGGEVLTQATYDDQWITLHISDNGIGISPEALPHLFQRFRRPGADPTVRGMGLGLYLSRLLTEAQGGKIAASSAGVGKGATFSMSLRIAADHDDENEERRVDR